MRYRFGTYELDSDQYELRNATQVVRIEPRVLDVLFYLVRNRDRVVPREELLDEVWKTRFVSESALSRCIMQARKAVGTDDPSDAQPIKTIHRRGYRFVAPVEEDEERSSDVPVVDPAPKPHRTGTIDPAAAKLCARARELAKKRTPESVRSAIVLLRDAIEIEPDHAPAFATLGECYLFIGYLQQAPPDSVFPKARAALARAIELEPELADAHACRGFVENVYGWNAATAEEALKTAMALDPGLAIAHHRYGLHLLTQRRFDDAETSLRHAARLDPLSPILGTACGLPSMARGDAAGAIEIYRTVIASEPRFFPVRFYLGLAFESCGRLDEAIGEFRSAVENADAATEALPALAHALALAGSTREAAAIVERLHLLATERYISPFFFAVTAMGSGDYDEALQRLNESVDMHAIRMSDLHLDRRFAPLHQDDRFVALLNRIGLDPDSHRQDEPRWWRSRRT